MRPTVHQAHAICDLLKARGVIVIAFTPGGLAGVSYGETKLECKQLAYTLDRIVEDIEDGRIPVWATQESANLPAGNPEWAANRRRAAGDKGRL